MPALYTLPQIQHVLPSNTYNAIIQSIANGFALLHQQQVQLAPVVHLGPFSSHQIDDACIKAGYITQQEHFVIKIATGGFASNLRLGLPTADGLMVVFSQKTGQCEGILLDEGWLTDMRTAAAGAVAARLLAPTGVQHIGMIGTGIQARFQLQLLKLVHTCRSVLLWGRNKERTLAAKHDIEQLGFTVELAPSIQYLCHHSRFIVTTTSSTSPLLKNEWVQPGTHITAVGADGIGKQELDPLILQRASAVVCDEIQQCVSFGETSHAVQAGLLKKEDVLGLGELVVRERNNNKWKRQNLTDITVFDSTGVAVQDVSIASLTLSLLKESSRAGNGGNGGMSKL